MKAQELRIGNIVDYYGTHIVLDGVTKTYITTDDERVIDVIDPKNEGLKGIPLTLEWLERFGLIREGVGKYALYCHGVPILRYWISDGAVNVGYYIKMSIHYVHQLQNLYFALTGEELELKK